MISSVILIWRFRSETTRWNVNRHDIYYNLISDLNYSIYKIPQIFLLTKQIYRMYLIKLYPSMYILMYISFLFDSRLRNKIKINRHSIRYYQPFSSNSLDLIKSYRPIKTTKTSTRNLSGTYRCRFLTRFELNGPLEFYDQSLETSIAFIISHAYSHRFEDWAKYDK